MSCYYLYYLQSLLHMNLQDQIYINVYSIFCKFITNTWYYFILSFKFITSAQFILWKTLMRNRNFNQDLCEFIRTEFEQPEFKSWLTEFKNKVLNSSSSNKCSIQNKTMHFTCLLDTSAFWQQKLVSNLQYL